MSTMRGTQATMYEQQWTLTDVQLFNWGCFHGYVRVDLPAAQSIITGASGAGKSTLLDAHTALMYRNDARFNTASNPATQGRARSDEERNVTKYIRGRVAVGKDLADQAQYRVLREGTVWSALAETYSRSDGKTLTIFVAHYLRPQDSKPWVTRWALRTSRFDLRDLQQFASGEHTARPFPKARIQDRFPGTRVCDGPTDFRRQVYEEMGLSPRAVRLLEDIQGAAGIASITALFQSLVFDKPHTYEAADTALEHFASCQQTYQDLRDNEDQIELLRPIRQWYSELQGHRADEQFLAPLGASVDPRESSFWWWVRDLQDRLLGAAEDAARGREEDAIDARTLAQQKATDAKAAVDDARRRVAAAGGSQAALLEQQVSAAEKELEQARKAHARYVSLAEGVTTIPSSQREHGSCLTESRHWLSGYDAREHELQAERDALVKKEGKADDEVADLKIEGAYLVGRRDLIPEHMHRERHEIADAVGLSPEQLPFLAELIDVDPKWEPWRMAIEKALGGLAYRLLVPARSAETYRQLVNDVQTRTRYQWLAVPVRDAQMPALDPDTAVGRLQFKHTHPYRVWLANFLSTELNHLCVDDGAALNRLPTGRRGLTEQGQVRSGSGGAHGGQQGHRSIIGFSPQLRLDQIRDRMQELHGVLQGIADAMGQVSTRQASHARHKAVHEHVVQSDWDAMDVTDRQEQYARLVTQRDKLWADNPDLASAEADKERLETAHEAAIEARANAAAAADTAAAEYLAIVERKDEVARHQRRMLEADVPEPDCAKLTAMFTDWCAEEPTLEAVTRARLGRFAQKLNTDRGRSRQDADARYSRLAEAFAEYNRRWPDPNRGDNPDDSFDEFDALLTDRLATGFDVFRDKFVTYTSRMTGLELVKIRQQFEAGPRSIADRLNAINAVLSKLDFSSRGGTINIVSRTHRSSEADRFLSDLAALSEDATAVIDFDSAVAKFERLLPLMEQIDPDKAKDKGSRDRILDVRRHVTVEAEHYLPDRTLFDTYNTPADKSGGEMQEVAMFILGVALRYQLGDIDAEYPRFATVFMDEGMVKADPEHTDRALRVWSALGFQLVVALPVEKFESAQQTTPSYSLQISRDDSGRSRIDPLVPLP